MSNITNKERARRYRDRLKKTGGRTLSFYIDGTNDKRLKALMEAHELGQGDALKFAIELAYRATFEPELKPEPQQDKSVTSYNTSNDDNIKKTQPASEKPFNRNPTLEDIQNAIEYKSGIYKQKVTVPKDMLVVWLKKNRGNNSLSELVTTLNNAEIPTLTGKKWTTGSLDGFMRRHCNW